MKEGENLNKFQYGQATESLSPKIYNCCVGGMPVKMVVKDKNIMSQVQFRKLREEKWKFFTAEKCSFKVDGMDFCAQFTSTVEINNCSQIVTFFVQEGNKDIISLSSQIAQRLGLQFNLNEIK